MIVGEHEILGQVRHAWEAAVARRQRHADAPAAVPARGRVGQAGPHRDRDRPALGVDPGRRRFGRGRTARNARARAGPRDRRRQHGPRPRVDVEVARRLGPPHRQPHRRTRRRARRAPRRRGDPAHRRRRHARRRRRRVLVHRFGRSVARTLDRRDGDGVSQRSPLADRRCGPAARRRSRRARDQRRHPARPRRPEGLRATFRVVAPRRDRQGPRDPLRRDRAVPHRAGRP